MGVEPPGIGFKLDCCHLKRIGRTIIVKEDEPVQSISSSAVIYARVSAAENESNLNNQADRL
ncbi:MAG: hypothetical protein J2P21_07610, partial [Chloracidobacterium sp.]|nr:hypothetical protein [Chloracidobacterium sp.]